MYKVFFPFILLVIIFFQGCANSPLHNNPVDPLCPWADITIYGRVHDLNGDPISGCTLSLVNQEIMEVTDDSGKYVINNVMPFPDTLIINADGYKGDTVYISPQPGEELSMDFLLYGVPIIKKERVYSYRLFTSLPVEIAGIICETEIYDPDRIVDIRNVRVMYKDNTIYLNLYKIVDDNSGVYRSELTYEEEGPQIFNMVGLKFVSVVEDYEDIVTVGEGTNLVRFVDIIPDVIYPFEGGTLSYGDTIRWRVSPPSYHAIVNLFITQNDSIVWSKENLSVYDSVYVFDGMLSSGDYELVVQVMDDYGDWTAKEVWIIGE